MVRLANISMRFRAPTTQWLQLRSLSSSSFRSSRSHSRTSLAFATRPPIASLSASIPALSGSRSHTSSFSHTILVFPGSRRYESQVVKVPTMAESLSEGTLKQWVKKIGDFVEADQEVATIETDKIDVAVNSPEAGTIIELFANEEDTVQVGQDLFKLDLNGAPSEGASDPQDVKPKEDVTSNEPKSKTQSQEETIPVPHKSSGPDLTSPSPPTQPARRTDPKQPTPAPKASEKRQDEKPSQSSAFDVNSVFGSREERRVKMNRMRLRIAERLKESQNTAAALTTFNEVDMSSLIDMRSIYKEAVLKKHEIKLGFMSAFVRASVIALQEVPNVNASIEGPNGGDTIVYRDYCDISVAVATPKGLVTPVLRNAETKSFVEIEKEIHELGLKARENKLTLEDMAGGTFSISNGGVFGSLMGTPIINLPQTAILGMHAVKDRAVVINGKVEVRPMMYLALTYDHRLVDGREAVTFLKTIKEMIEDPRRMLLGV